MRIRVKFPWLNPGSSDLSGECAVDPGHPNRAKEWDFPLDGNRVDLEVENGNSGQNALRRRFYFNFEQAGNRITRNDAAETSGTATDLGPRVAASAQTRRLELHGRSCRSPSNLFLRGLVESSMRM